MQVAPLVHRETSMEPEALRRALVAMAATVATALATLTCQREPTGKTERTDAAAVVAEAGAAEAATIQRAALVQRAAKAAQEVEVRLRAAAPFTDGHPSGLIAPVIWGFGESHIIHLEWVVELEGSQNITPGLGAGLSVGGGPTLWANPPPWHRNSGYSGKQTFEQQALIDAEVPLMSPQQGTTYGVYISGSNDAINNNLTVPATRATVLGWWSSMLSDALALSGMAPANLLVVSPLISTSVSVESGLVAFRPDVIALCGSLGTTYVDAMAGPYALTAADVTGDNIHLTPTGYTKLGKTLALARGYVVL